MKTKNTLYATVTLLLLCSACVGTGGADAATRQEIIEALELEPMNDEACIGYYREMYTCPVNADHEKERPASSLIYYLMPGGMFDPWHKLASDEILVYHAGVPMQQLLIYPDGKTEEYILGPDPTQGHVQQVIIPAGTWMGFRIMTDDPDSWGLYGVFCSPAFHLDDISTTTGPELGRQFPHAVEQMKRLRMYAADH